MFFVHIFSRMLESLSQGLSQLTDSIALSMLEDFLYNAPKKTIGAPKDCFEVKLIDMKIKNNYIYVMSDYLFSITRYLFF